MNVGCYTPYLSEVIRSYIPDPSCSDKLVVHENDANHSSIVIEPEHLHPKSKRRSLWAGAEQEKEAEIGCKHEIVSHVSSPY